MGGWFLTEFKKSDVIKHLLTTMINISGRKTTKGHAINSIDSVMKQLESRYGFLKHVQIKDTRYIEDEDPVSVMIGINDVASSEIGEAVYAIITGLDKSLGKEAGHFFIKEIQNNLGDEYNSYMKDMGVDLGLMQLEREIEQWGKMITNKK